jgi:hypothetical protein
MEETEHIESDSDFEQIEDSAEVDATDSTEGESPQFDLRAAQKLRRESQALRQRLKDQESELTQLREAQMDETDRRVAEARREAEESMRTEVTKSRLREVAAGRLNNPADAVVFCDLANLDLDDQSSLEAEITRVLEERPYLGIKSGPTAIDQGPRTSPKPQPTFKEYMAQELASKRG